MVGPKTDRFTTEVGRIENRAELAATVGEATVDIVKEPLIKSS